MWTTVPVAVNPSVGLTLGVVSGSFTHNSKKSLPEAREVCRCTISPLRQQPLNRRPSQPAGLISAIPRIWSLTGFSPVNTANLCFLASCRHHCQQLKPPFCSCLRASRLLRSRWYSPWCVHLMTLWLHRATPMKSGLLWFLEMDGPTNFRGKWKRRRSTVPALDDEQDTNAQCQLTHNFKCQVFTLVELLQRTMNKIKWKP